MSNTIRNTLVQYKGGGYDGCFWEWNFFLLDGRGKFHNLKSTGSMGVKNRAEAMAVINGRDRFKEVYTYNLKKNKALKEFEKETHGCLVGEIVEAVNKACGRAVMSWHCEDCGVECNLAEEMFTNGEYRFEKMLCADCYCSYVCGYCGEVNEPEENNADEEGHCIPEVEETEVS